MSSLEGNTIYWRKNSEPWQSELVTDYRSFNDTLIPKIPGLSASVNNAQVQDVYTLSDAMPGPSDGQTLAWDSAAGTWQPADPNAAAVRAALGIGEYADDAAAGTGGVASGAMYYNTTSSDYRVKA